MTKSGLCGAPPATLKPVTLFLQIDCGRRKRLAAHKRHKRTLQNTHVRLNLLADIADVCVCVAAVNSIHIADTASCAIKVTTTFAARDIQYMQFCIKMTNISYRGDTLNKYTLSLRARYQRNRAFAIKQQLSPWSGIKRNTKHVARISQSRH